MTSVLRGERVSEGDGLVVYDAYKITEPRNGLGTGQFSDVREVWRGSAGPSRFGLMPLRAGQEYLFLLEPKRYPSEKDPATYEQTYCLIEHPYARISLDLAEHPERGGVFELPAEGEWRASAKGMRCHSPSAGSAKTPTRSGCSARAREMRA